MTPEAYKKYQLEREQPKQPDHCKGCIWGRWTGAKQVCSVPRCFKGKSQAFRNLSRAQYA
ncbi:hypothetical protein PaecuDRAFT_3114 [Paenibacillus curdlanolyticus YK9]|uniref:Uncharacterized protein n=1 Tax=Paenibacillus curdlanolyticus YK9 TaxID=717606 RepID=E0IBS5_9BACL|nr:hypothetical protein PaecuDRAFT_3114 [Paenibacillus curdlanolyticus YK9]